MKVKLHSNHPDAVAATDNTLKALGGGVHELKRDPNGNVVFDDEGFAEVATTNPGYFKFACTRQGYVAEVRD